VEGLHLYSTKELLQTLKVLIRHNTLGQLKPEIKAIDNELKRRRKINVPWKKEGF